MAGRRVGLPPDPLPKCLWIFRPSFLDRFPSLVRLGNKNDKRHVSKGRAYGLFLKAQQQTYEVLRIPAFSAIASLAKALGGVAFTVQLKTH